MRVLIFLLVFTLVAFNSAAQETGADDNIETLIDEEFESGGYGAFLIGPGQIYDDVGLFIGGQGAWIINDWIALGGRGYGLTNEIQVNDLEKYRLDFGCGGGLIEYIIASDKLIHFKIHTMIGAGDVSYTKIESEHNQNGPLEPEYKDDGVFVFEPGADVVLNVGSFFRIGLGATYRMVSDVDYYDLSNSDLSGVSGKLTLMFGAF